MSDRTTCFECGEELWGAAEISGYCVMCQRRERDEQEADDRADAARATCMGDDGCAWCDREAPW